MISPTNIRDSVNEGACPYDTDGDGNCGRPACKYCSDVVKKHRSEVPPLGTISTHDMASSMVGLQI